MKKISDKAITQIDDKKLPNVSKKVIFNNFYKPNKTKIIIFLIFVALTLFLPMSGGWLAPDSIYHALSAPIINSYITVDVGYLFIFLPLFVLIPWLLFYHISCLLYYINTKSKKINLENKEKLILTGNIITTIIIAILFYIQYYL